MLTTKMRSFDVRWMLAAGLFLVAATAQAEPRHGASMFGELKYGPDFTHFDYVNPEAPKGGTVTLAAIGTFDSLNPFIIKGSAATGLGLIFETLTTRSGDEAFSEYGLLAETIDMPEDRSWVAFELRPEARWHDGVPVTAEDVKFSFETLRDKGQPFYRAYYANVSEVIVEGDHRIMFKFDGSVNRELPLILGQLPVLPAHYYADVEFDATTLTPPVGSGPYRIKTVESGRRIVYERDPDYWAKDLPVNKGRYNFGEMRFEYYRDANIALEAFKAGQFDFRVENTARLWATAYNGPAVERGDIILEEFPEEGGTGMQAFAFNTRRPMFQDPEVRRAMAYAFDFEWTNEALFFGQYARTESYFSNSELAATGLPSPEELKLLEPWRDQLRPEVFEAVYTPPSTDGSGNLRGPLRTALGILRDAGWTVEDGVLTNSADGTKMEFEILLVSPAFERIVNPFVKNLERLGIRATVRTVDPSQYQNRLDAFDFDMIVAVWGQSLSPGNEQREFWGCDAATSTGSRNYLGICDPAVEALIDEIIQAPSREELITATRALDRVLTWSYYVIPHWHSRTQRVARWNIFGIPETLPKYGLDLQAWWVDPELAAVVQGRKATGG